MVHRNLLVLLLISQLFNASKGSQVKVIDGGYEDIVFAIHPDVKEDNKMIHKIQEMVKEASSYLFQATKKRLFIRSVKILIPSTWTPGNDYTKPATETYNTADIIISHPYLKYGDDPYTLQYGRCGEPGRYIHLTPNFLQDDNLLSVYGPRGRVFVHEWAHLRWGVYDEYNEDKPYYVSGSSKVEATRCSPDIWGINVMKTSECFGESCPTKACLFDSAIGLYEEGCVFLPYTSTSQFSQESIMYTPAFSTVTDFCDSNTHNTEAPNLQNRMCNFRSTWDVIKDSTDISFSPPRPDFSPPVPSFTLMQYRDRGITVVRDASGSMIMVGSRIIQPFQMQYWLVLSRTIINFAICFIINTQLESTDLDLKPRACLNGTIFIDRTVGNDTSFMVTWQTAIPDIHLQDPEGIIYTQVQFSSTATSKLSTLQLSGTAKRGRWDYGLCNPLTSNQVVGITAESKAADNNVPPIIASCHMNSNTNDYPKPMVIYASLSQGLVPVTGAKVTAMIESESGTLVTTELLDNGAGVDIAINDGIYSRYFTSFTENGKYSLKVRVISEDNQSRLTLPRSRALYIPGYIDNDKIFLNPPKPNITDEDLQHNCGAFSRAASGGSFVVSNIPSGVLPDIHTPEKISDLEAKLVQFRTILSWTATGDDLDQGQASKYELRMNTDPQRIRDHFETSTLVNTDSFIPQPAGFKENFLFVPESITIANGTTLYFAIVAIDKMGQKSDRSNIAQSVFYNVPLPPPTTSIPNADTTRQELTTAHKLTLITSVLNTPSKDSNGKISTLAITAIVCSAVVLICLIVCIVICVEACKKNKGHHV
ncbi:calcium-activated chloride channel regulator 1-like [Bufo bufo]|uniref:calcium-activated chloride channel regulator 1-like n=1 Tax=Bufo bufo TaxID=8384 RepID=UPI001ABDCB76|nr:calcium-activated chloride channel regulator 1-like [Bufo bufo]